MPTYEYQCKACGHQLDIVQAFSDDALTTCPACHAQELRKVFGSVGIAFKGSGFYKNDSRSTVSSASSVSSGKDNGSTSSPASSDSSSSTPSTPSSTTSTASSATSTNAKSA